MQPKSLTFALYLFACVISSHVTLAGKKFKDKEVDPSSRDDMKTSITACLHDGKTLKRDRLLLLVQKLDKNPNVYLKLEGCLKKNFEIDIKDPGDNLPEFCAALDKSLECALKKDAPKRHPDQAKGEAMMKALTRCFSENKIQMDGKILDAMQKIVSKNAAVIKKYGKCMQKYIKATDDPVNEFEKLCESFTQVLECSVGYESFK